MSGKESVDKVAKGLGSLIDDFTAAVKELVNAGEETVVHLAVGSGRAITAVINAAGEVTKVGVETVGNVAGSVAGGVTKAIGLDKKKEEDEDSRSERIRKCICCFQ